jgi:hypothetical protein
MVETKLSQGKAHIVGGTGERENADSTWINTYSHEFIITGHRNENRNLP